MAEDPETVVPPLLWDCLHAIPATCIDADGELLRGPGVFARVRSILRARRRDPLRFAHAAAGYRHALDRAATLGGPPMIRRRLWFLVVILALWSPSFAQIGQPTVAVRTDRGDFVAA